MRLRAPIAALDVRELVHERRLPRLSRPRRRRRRHHHHRRKQSRDVRTAILQRLPDGDRVPSVRCAGKSTRASLFQLSGAGLDPLHTDRPLRTQQNRNQPKVPRVPTVPMVPRVGYQIVPAVPRSTVGAAVGTAVTLGTSWNTTLGTSGTPGTIGTLIAERHDGRREQDDDDGEMPDEMPRRRSGAAK